MSSYSGGDLSDVIDTSKKELISTVRTTSMTTKGLPCCPVARLDDPRARKKLSLLSLLSVYDSMSISLSYLENDEEPK